MIIICGVCVCVRARAPASALTCGCGCRKTALWRWFSLSGLLQVPACMAATFTGLSKFCTYSCWMFQRNNTTSKKFLNLHHQLMGCLSPPPFLDELSSLLLDVMSDLTCLNWNSAPSNKQTKQYSLKYFVVCLAFLTCQFLTHGITQKTQEYLLHSSSLKIACLLSIHSMSLLSGLVINSTWSEVQKDTK